jgi:Flp pilus assembly CpaE family ATPase
VCWFTWTFEIIARSDGVVVTGINTIPGLRQLSETVGAVRGVRGSLDQMAVAVNRCERRLLGGIARRRHVEEVLGRDNVFYVRNDPMVLQSVNMGVPMAMAKSSRQANSDIVAIGAFCAGMKPLRSAVPSIDLGMR